VLQLGVSFGLLNSLPQFVSPWFLNNLSFYGGRLLASRPTPNLEDQGILFIWLLPLDLSGIVNPISSYAIAGIALRVSGALKPHHHDKV
jgi:hypothetical protein